FDAICVKSRLPNGGSLAQPVEQLPFKELVDSSILSGPTIFPAAAVSKYVCGGVGARVGHVHERLVLRLDIAARDEIIQVEHSAPVVGSYQHHGYRVDRACEHEIQRFVNLIERAETARERDQRSRSKNEVHLAQREVSEAERKSGCDVGIRLLLVRQTDVETNAGCARLRGAAIGRFH
ncbi:MAG: hypothetical protein RL321_749, partial [Pseudomonadota bacterium]